MPYLIRGHDMGCPSFRGSSALFGIAGYLSALVDIVNAISADLYATQWSLHRVGSSPAGPIALATIGVVVAIAAVPARHAQAQRHHANRRKSCSAAISAACHPSDSEDHLGLLQWGVEPDDESSRRDSEMLHCTLSTRPVVVPQDGERYR